MERLGQHFLKNRRKIKKIVDALELKDGDIIIEIGPGHGELTKEIKNKKLKIKIIAIEKDKILFQKLKQDFRQEKNIEIIEGDSLKTIPRLFTEKRLIAGYKIIGNIPYYITGRLFRILGSLITARGVNCPINNIVLTVQKEVAERLSAKPPKMNLLAASVQLWAEPKIIDFISKNDFHPRPKVDSAIVKLKTNKNPQPKTHKQYYQLIKILFKQPRKTILNNLRNGFLKIKKEQLIRAILNAGVNPKARPQNLSAEKIKKLAELLYN